MKLLYISHFDSTGYGKASIENVLCMDSVGIDVVPRPFILNNKPIVEGRLKELMNKSTQGCDTVIFHTLPHFIERGDFKKHICLFASETDCFDDSNWSTYLNLADQVWTISEESKDACINSNVNKPIWVVPHPCNPDKYKREYTRLNLPCLDDDVVFYTVSEWSRRKNISAILKAFHLEFDRVSDNAQLLIKVNKSGMDNQTLSKEVGNFCNEIKKGLKIYQNISDYKPELVLCEHLTEEQLMSLHYSCDCFVSSSYGEAFCLPLFDACAIGNYGISTDCGGPRDYLAEYEYGELVDATIEPCFGAIDSVTNLYTGNENWHNISINGLRRAMRGAYNTIKYNRKAKQTDIGMELAEKYSYNTIGQKIREYLME